MYLRTVPRYVSQQQPLLTLDMLATDKIFEEQDLHPGDELMCLGYPLGLESNAYGFPVLRSGRIASFPIKPSSVAESFLYDIEVYGGNSGGPVYIEQIGRMVGNTINFNATFVYIVGLIVQDVSYTRQIETYFESGTRKDPMGLAVVVPAEFILQTINLLPPIE